jgi:type I site-specific restriction-modification system R (restriction) subunit
VITDAIRDQNVLRFGIEYVGKYKNKSNAFIDIEVEEIDKQEVLNSEKRINKIVDYIIAYHDQKTFNKDYSALLAVSSIDNVMQYYDLFRRRKKQENTICVLLLFSPMAVMKIQTKQMIAFQMMNKNTIGRQNQRPPINQVTAEIN